MEPVPRRPTLWSHVRGALLLGVLLINFCQGFPVPRIEAKHIDRPSGRTALQQWGNVLRGVGFDISNDELRDLTLEKSAAIADWHGHLVAPVMPAFHQTQIRQRWSLFASSDPHPWWIHVEGRFEGDDDYRLLWRPMDPEADVLQTLFEYRRLRGIWNPGSEELRGDHPRFLRFTTNILFEEFPDLVAVRVRYKRFYVHIPGDGPPNEHEEWRWESRDHRDPSQRRQELER